MLPSSVAAIYLFGFDGISKRSYQDHMGGPNLPNYLVCVVPTGVSSALIIR